MRIARLAPPNRNTGAGISEAFVRLADFSGRVHYFEELELSGSGQTEVFEMELPANLKDGFYSLSLITDKRTVAGKLVLMR